MGDFFVDDRDKGNPFEASYQKLKEKSPNLKSYLENGSEKSLLQFFQQFFSQISLSSQTQVLKGLVVGCGLGKTCFHLANLLAARVGIEGYQITGLDLSPTAIQLAQDLFSANPSLFFKVGSITSDLLKGKVSSFFDFDFILDDHCLHCLHGKDDRKSYWSNIYHLLKPGGIFYLETMVYNKNLQWNQNNFVLDSDFTLWRKDTQRNGYYPFRKLLKAYDLEQEILESQLKIFYFTYQAHLNISLEDNSPENSWPPILRAIAKKDS